MGTMEHRVLNLDYTGRPMPLKAMPRFPRWALTTIAAAFGAVATTSKLSLARAVVGYRGESIRLSRAYHDYEEYKNDPSNIHPDETTRVQKLVTGALVARTYRDRASLFRALSELPFPGYGSGSHGESTQADGTKLLLYEVEIPGPMQRGISSSENTSASTPSSMISSRRSTIPSLVSVTSMTGSPIRTRAEASRCANPRSSDRNEIRGVR